MPLSTDLEILNRALRDLSGSFLQYVGEIWPWTSVGSSGDQLKSVVDSCVARQRQSVAQISSYLASRQPRVEYGSFSAEFTDLHYVSLQYLVKQLIVRQSALVEFLNRSATLLPSGDDSQQVLATAYRNEQETLTALKQVAA